MITVTTLNSTYEIDEEHQLARSVVGVNDPTPRFALGGAGTWRQYLRIEYLEVGARMVIAWPPAGDDDGPGIELKTHTLSSTVTEIYRDVPYTVCEPNCVYCDFPELLDPDLDTSR